MEVQCGWGRLIFAHTFADPPSLVEAVLKEKSGQRDIAFYVTDPQIALKAAPHELFLDPSTTYRLNLETYEPEESALAGFEVGVIESRAELDEINRIYAVRQMVPLDADLVWEHRADAPYAYYVARQLETGRILGVAMGIDHMACFEDIMNGCSLWALAVDPQAEYPGVGRALVHHVCRHYQERSRQWLDLSVMHDNESAIRLYQQIGFEKVAVLAIKCRNQINEQLFVSTPVVEGFNIYAEIIIKEALRRGIAVDPIDPPRGFFKLSMGGRTVTCRESLTELTSAIAMTRSDDKQLTRDLLTQAGIKTPDQIQHAAMADSVAFLKKHGSVVVKPVHGEQGHGVFVDIRTNKDLENAVAAARHFDDNILIEQFVEGDDLRIIVINQQVVAAAVRKPAEVTGTGQHTVQELIERLSRRRSAATGGESRIPLDSETKRCVESAGYSLEDTLPDGVSVRVRKTANLHTGGTIHDVTEDLHPTLASAAVQAAIALEIPVVGFDFMVPAISGEDYVVIEANERPGLANHEPQPTAERFIDFLFPQTRSADVVNLNIKSS